MVTIFLQVLGWLVFTLVTVALGVWLRGHPAKKNAELTSRIVHTTFWVGVVPPAGLGIFYPGLKQFDEILGLNHLPGFPILPVVGILLLSIGVYLFMAANVVIRLSGKGAHAFLLTQNVVKDGVYSWSRNPMSLGFYLWSVGGGMVIGSTYLTFGTLLLVIPVHIFYLRYFEEYELELRLGQPYLAYKRKVSFMFPRWVFHRV